MDIIKLKYFQVVAKYEHITKASEELHISQPSLTIAIKQLEDELGVPLLEKKGRRVYLTEFGKYLNERTKYIIEEFDNVPNEISVLKNKISKRIRLNILAASSFVINAVVEYKKIRNDVVFDFEQNEKVSNSDIVVTTNELDSVNLQKYTKRCIKEERIYLAVPATSIYAKMDSVNLSDLKDESFVMFSSSRLFRQICNKLCSIAGFTPKVMFESDSPSAVHDVINSCAGVAFWPEYSWGKVKNKNIKLVPIKNPICQRQLIFEYYKRNSNSIYAEEFFEYLINLIK